MTLMPWLGRLPKVLQAVVVLFGLVIVFGAVGTVALGGYSRVLGMRPENRSRVYALRMSIGPGTPTEALDRLLGADENHELKRSPSPSGVSVWTPIGFIRD